MSKAEIIPGASDVEIARWLHERLDQALAASSGPIAITIPGGSTPFPILASLAELGLDWSRIAVWPGDDRIVPEDHAASNVGRIRAALEPLGAQVVALAEGLTPPHFALAWLGDIAAVLLISVRTWRLVFQPERVQEHPLEHTSE